MTEQYLFILVPVCLKLFVPPFRFSQFELETTAEYLVSERRHGYRVGHF